MRARDEQLTNRVARLILTLLLLVTMGQVLAEGQDAFSPSLWTGNANYTVAIEFPPGTGEANPNLSLSYTSGGGNDWLGQGWSLDGLGYIERLGPNYGPAPSYTASDTYLLVLGGSSYKLVNTGVDPSGLSGNYYRTEIESFLRISYVPTGNYWAVTDKAGRNYYLGTDSSSRQNAVTGTANIFRWYLTSVSNSSNVSWIVSYAKDLARGDIYPQQIVYSQGAGLACTTANPSACRTIDFTTEPRPDYTVSYEKGGTVISYQRLQRIDVKLGGQLVRRYALGYTQRAAASRAYAAVSQLTSITETGADGISTLPPQIFSYNVDANGSSLNLIQTAVTGPSAGVGGVAQTIPTEANCSFITDIDNDGLADIVAHALVVRVPERSVAIILDEVAKLCSSLPGVFDVEKIKPQLTTAKNFLELDAFLRSWK